MFGKLNNLMSDLKSQAYYQNNDFKREIKSYCFYPWSRNFFHLKIHYHKITNVNLSMLETTFMEVVRYFDKLEIPIIHGS